MSEASSSNYSLLIICGDPALSASISDVLTELHIDIAHALNGSEAILKAGSAQFQSIISELELPDAQLPEVIEEILSLQKIPPDFILLGSNPSGEMLAQLIKFGCMRDYVPKNQIPRLFLSVRKLKTQNRSIPQTSTQPAQPSNKVIETISKMLQAGKLTEEQLVKGLKSALAPPPQSKSAAPRNFANMAPTGTQRNANDTGFYPSGEVVVGAGGVDISSLGKPLPGMGDSSEYQGEAMGRALPGMNQVSPSRKPAVTAQPYSDGEDDFEMDSSTGPKGEMTMQEAMRLLRERLRKGDLELPTMSNVANEFTKMLRNPNVSNNKIVALLERDQSITSKVIKASNAAYYRRVKKVKNISDSLIRLGMKEVYNIVQTISLRKFFKLKNPQYEEIMENVWRNTIATAFVSRNIAQQINIQEPEEIYLCSLFVNTGEPFLVKLISEIQALASDFDRMERMVDKYHTEFGGTLLTSWKFDLVQIQVAAHHHKQTAILKKMLEPEMDTVIRNIHIANIAHALSEEKGFHYFNPKNTPFRNIPDIYESIEHLKINEEQLDHCLVGVQEFVEETESIVS